MADPKHEFAVYFKIPKNITDSNLIKISDEAIYHRVVRVLRVQRGDKVVLFDEIENVLCEVIEIDKKHIIVKVVSVKPNKVLEPEIVLLISMLKKEAFQEAVYSCVEIGANVIQPVITQKVHQKNFDEKELVRLNKIVVSAAEQSKNFNYPALKASINIENIKDILLKDDIKVYFDPEGQNILDFINTIPKTQVTRFVLMVGPEGDLTIKEKELLKSLGFAFCKLTPTILRAQTAAPISLSIFRSIF